MLQAGGGLTNRGRGADVNSPENVKALQFVSDLVTKHKVAPPEAPEMSYVEVHNMFIQGRAAMADNFQYMVRLGQNPEQSKIVDQFAVVPLPKGEKQAVIIGLWLFRHAQVVEEQGSGSSVHEGRHEHTRTGAHGQQRGHCRTALGHEP